MNFPRFLLPSLPLWKLVEASKSLDNARNVNDNHDSRNGADLDASTPRFSFDSDRSVGSASGAEDDVLSNSGESEYYTTEDDYEGGFQGYDDDEVEDEEEEAEDDDEVEGEYYDGDSGSEAAGSASGFVGVGPVTIYHGPAGSSVASGSAPSSYNSANDIEIGVGERRQSSGSSRRRGKRAATALNNAVHAHEELGKGPEGVRIGIRRSNTDRSQRQRSSVDGCLVATVSTLKCHRCQTDLCFSSSIISKGFTGRHGRAYLVSSLLPSNILHSKPTSRTLQTGPHTVADISCIVCGSNLGWKYLAAEDRSQRYKVGKYILETGKVIRSNHWEKHGGMHEDEMRDRDRKGWELGWEEGVGGGMFDDDSNKAGSGVDARRIEVDSEDEDELEEFFSGAWDPNKVARRREKRKSRAAVVV